jgi:hypothetical protein
MLNAITLKSGVAANVYKPPVRRSPPGRSMIKK